jgi:RND family efflux transporter MFP subunit
MKKVLLTLFIVALGGGGWYAVSQGWLPGVPRVESPKNGAIQPTAIAELRDIHFSIQLSGDLSPVDQLDLKPEVGGRLDEVRVKPGQRVNKGDLVAKIDGRDLMSERETTIREIEGANVMVEKLERNFKRAEELFEQKLISQEVFDNLKSELDLARNTLAKAENRRALVEVKLSRTEVRSPMNGTVLTVPVVPGQVVIAAASVSSGTTLTTIANLSKLLVESHVNQVDVAHLKVGQTVRLTAEALRDEPFEADITFIAPVAAVKNSVKGFTVQAIVENPSPRLRPGMTVQMKVPVHDVEGALSVPVAAVFRGEADSRVVYVKSDDGPERRPIEVGVSDFMHVQVLSGLAAGEEILLSEPNRTGTKNAAARGNRSGKRPPARAGEAATRS